MPAIVLIILSFVVGTIASAQEPADEIFQLASGESFEGRLLPGSDRKLLRVETRLGRRDLEAESVLAHRPSAEQRRAFENERNELKDGDVARAMQLVRNCKARGLTSGLVDLLDAILLAEPGHEEALAILTEAAPRFRLAKPNPQPEGKPRRARAELDLLYAAARSASPAQAAMLRAQIAAIDVDLDLNEHIDAAERGTPPQRWIAASMLGETADKRRVRFLYRRALGDPDWRVRDAAVASLRRRDDGSTLGPFVRALFNAPHDSTRVYAAEAMMLLGDRRAVPPLAEALRGSSGGGPVRNNVVVTRQQAYIKDFDVEIAQAAVIADPIVDTLTEGVVLDVGVVSVNSQRKVYLKSLRRLTGVDFGDDADAWSRWKP